MNTQNQQIGVFLCQGGGSQPESSEFRQLKWSAESAMGGGKVFAISQACQAQGARAMAKLCAENTLDGVVLGACASCQSRAGFERAAREMGAELGFFQELDICQKLGAAMTGCQVAPGARRTLMMALARLRESQKPQPPQAEPCQRVLVLGAGLAALWTVNELSRAGYGVVLVTPSPRLTLPENLYGPQAANRAEALRDEVQNDPAIELIKGGELLGLSGGAGDFRAIVRDMQDERIEMHFGAVIFTNGPAMRLNLDMEPGRHVLGLDKLLKLMDAPQHFKKRFGEGPLRVGLAVGLGRQASPAQMEAACLAAMALNKDFSAQVTLFTNYAKVALPDLEELSQRMRDNGVILVKSTDYTPRFTLSARGPVVEYRDEIAQIELNQELDLLAVDIVPDPAAGGPDLPGLLGLAPNSSGFLYDDRPGLELGLTARRGIYALGPASGVWSMGQLWEQIGQSVSDVTRLLAAGQGGAPISQVKVDRKKCALCLTCVRVCPTGAMGRIERRPFSNPLACTGCGTCASECPMDAIQLINLEDQRLNGVLKAGLAPRDSWRAFGMEPEVLVLACANSAMRSLQKARRRGKAWPQTARLVELPCAGKIDPELVLRAFRDGYDLVQVLACHPGACQSLEGNTWAGLRRGHLEQMLEEAGLEPARLLWGSSAPNMENEALSLVESAVAKAENMGPSPLKAAAKVRNLLSKFTLKVDESYTIIP